MPGPHFPVLSDPLDREWRSCIFACLMTACLYTIIGMVSGEKVGTCVGYLAYPFLENDQFFEQMCQVASTSLTMKHMTSALLRWVANGDQGQHTPHTVFPLKTGRSSCIGWWKRTNRSVEWQPPMGSPMKRSAASCFMSRSRVGSKKRHGPVPLTEAR